MYRISSQDPARLNSIAALPSGSLRCWKAISSTSPRRTGEDTYLSQDGNMFCLTIFVYMVTFRWAEKQVNRSTNMDIQYIYVHNYKHVCVSENCLHDKWVKYVCRCIDESMDGETTQTVIVYTKTHLQTIAFLQGILVICVLFLDQPGSHQSRRTVERLGGAPESFCALKNSKTGRKHKGV